MLNNANLISKNMKSMLKSKDMVHNRDMNQLNPPNFPVIVLASSGGRNDKN